jgi:hypothetical protein
MNKAQRLLLPFFCGFLAGPVFIVLHEWGHFMAARSIGWGAKLHFAETQFDVPKEEFTQRRIVLVSSAGPLVQILLAAAGFLWLRTSRVHRLSTVVTPGDWVATTLALNVGRWLRSFTGPLSDDEAFISRAMGLPGWLFPYFLGLVAIVAIVATIRLHPPGARLIPFLTFSVGGMVGAFLWMKVAGPFLLP